MTEHEFGRRRETWGDDPEEIEASATVAEFTSDTEIQRAWHEHPAWVPLKVVWRFIARNGRRVGVTIAGFAVLIAGVAMLVLPGPGLVVICLGLAILGTEYVWAQRMLHTARVKAEQAKDAVLRKKQAPPSAQPPRDDGANPQIP